MCIRDRDWIIQQLESIGTPVDLVGHDWGGMLTARVASIRPDLVRTWTSISGPIDPDYKWYEIAETWQTPGEGERWMADLDLDAFTEQLTSNYRVPSEEARVVARYFDDAMKGSILALYRSAVHVGACLLYTSVSASALGDGATAETCGAAQACDIVILITSNTSRSRSPASAV